MATLDTITINFDADSLDSPICDGLPEPLKGDFLYMLQNPMPKEHLFYDNSVMVRQKVVGLDDSDTWHVLWMRKDSDGVYRPQRYFSTTIM